MTFTASASTEVYVGTVCRMEVWSEWFLQA